MKKVGRTTLMRRIGAGARADEGVSIIEVAVAALVFVIISVGVAQTLTSLIRLSGDQRHRVTAIGLATSELDLVRSATDAFLVSDRTYKTDGIGSNPAPLDGIVYTVERDVSWVNSNGIDVSCQSGGGSTLQLMRVNVRVTWEGQLAGTRPVSDDTVLSPNRAVADPTKGTIAVSVLDAAGEGVQGVDVSLTPTPLGVTVYKTDSDGCSYVVGVTPGTYTVSINKGGGYVDLATMSSTGVSPSLTVTEGGLSSTAFTYDVAANLQISRLPSGYSGVWFPTDAVDQYIYTNTSVEKDASGSNVSVFPWSSGYQIVPGGGYSQSCLSPNPSEWGASGSRGPGIGIDTGQLEPGQTVAVAAPWGVVDVQTTGSGWSTGFPNATRYLIAERAGAGDGDPGCSTPTTLRFWNGIGRNQSAQIALPYGTWTIRYSTSRTSTSSPSTAGLSISGNSTGSTPSGTTITLDPRPAS